MDISTFITPVLNLGLVPVLLLLFVRYFFDKDKARERQITELSEQFAKREALLHTDMVRREEQYKERERILVTENAQREDILKKEAEKREQILREEAEKRETSLLETIKNFTNAMKDLFDNVTVVKDTTTRLENLLRGDDE